MRTICKISNIHILAVILFMSLISPISSASPQKPDFAFPDKVEKTAQRDLNASLAANDGQGTVSALIHLGLAKQIVNTDSLKPLLAQVARVTDEEKNPVTRALLNALMATMYRQIYQSDSYIYNERETSDVASDDYTLWSREQFLDKVTALTDSSLKDASLLQKEPISEYSRLVELGATDRIFYPTLYDFIAQTAISNLEAFSYYSGGLRVLNKRLMSDPSDSSLYPGATCAPLGDILRIYDALITFHKDSPAPLFLQETAVRRFIDGHLYQSGDRQNRYYAEEFDEDYVEEGSSGNGLTELSPFISEMLRLYQENENNEYSALFLVPYAESSRAGSEAANAYMALLDYKRKFPNYFDINVVTNIINRLKLPSGRLRIPQVAEPGRDVAVSLESVNGRKVTVEFFDITSSAMANLADNSVQLRSLPSPMFTHVEEFTDSVPFNDVRKFNVKFPKYGIYTYRLIVDGVKSPVNNYDLIRVSDLSVASTVVGSETSAWVIDPVTGAPVKGASLYFRPWSNRTGFVSLNVATDTIGCAPLKIKDSGSVAPRKEADIFAPSISVWPTGRDYSEKARIDVNIFTSLALYRPGDDVDFSIVTFRSEALKREIAPRTSVSLTLYDANRQPVDTIRMTTDDWGRAQGKFQLPSSGLTGNFSIQASTKESTGSGYASFEVSDYKLPTFHIEKIVADRPANIKSPGAVHGVAETYSGFPVADAVVKAKLKVRSGFWWWATTSPVFFTAETRTDADGKFTIDIPASAISSAPAPDGLFVCDIDVTSADGETRSGTATFNLGKPVQLSVSVPAAVNLDKPFSALIEGRNASLDTVSVTLNFEISKCSYPASGKARSDKKGEVVSRGSIVTGSTTENLFAEILKLLKPGAYKVTFTPVDKSIAEPITTSTILLYTTKSDVCPAEKPLWIPETSLHADADGNVTIPLGSDCDDAWVRMIATVYPGKIVLAKWLRPAKGMQSISFHLPEGAKSAEVELSCVKNYKSYSDRVHISAAQSVDAIDVKIETFRDKVTPLQQEKITMRIIPKGNAAAQSAVILDMSNAAIDALASNSFDIPTFTPSGWTHSMRDWSFGFFLEDASKPYNALKTYNIVTPAFNFYGMQFGNNNRFGRNLHIRGMRAISSSVNQLADADEVVMEEASFDMAEKKVYMGAAPMAAESTAAGAVEKDAGSEDNREKEDSYRPSEIPLAFFRPLLTTEPDGTLEISYEVPDANTTWILRALAYNRQTLAGNSQAEIVASKPVMVSLNAPRFLSTGDVASLASSIMNNSSDTLAVKVLAEVVNTSTGKVVSARDSVLILAPKASAVASVPVTAPADAPGLILRVKASGGDFTDGEQALIPVLPSRQDVIESEMFYLAPDNARFTLGLPAMGEGERAFLNFTENPAWEVVSALPGLRDNQIDASVEASAALFSACVAEGLINSNPELARVLRHWLDNPGDSALVSNLQKNSQLKAMLLSATPWVGNALNDTERMQRLALLFDKRQTARVKREAVELLAKTRVGGGWCWTPKYKEVSQFCTEVILEELGDLRRMGWLPDDKRLNNWIKESCEYLDREAVKTYKNNPETDSWLYVAIRDAFPEVKRSTAASRVVEAQVQRCIAQWKEQSVALRGVYASILDNHGYHATARQILESLRQMATSTPERGMWWQQLDGISFGRFDRIGATSIILDAFHQIEPLCADVDKIRQFLILNKTNNDWGDAVITSQVITSLLTSGKPLKVNAKGTAIHIGDALVTPASPEYATGAFTEQITSLLKKPETMVIDRQADYPSVGGVVMMRHLPMDSIKSSDCMEISVGKSLSVFDGSQWVAADSFKIGDRVRVELVLRVEDDLSYVVINDRRAAALEPVEQLPAPIWSEGLCFYRENRDSQTNIFISWLPRGTYRLSYELFAAQSGTFSSGAAQVQSQYNPIVSAHSSGMIITVK